MAKVIPITEHFQHFLAEMKDTFLGRSVRADEAGVEAVVGSRVGAAAGPLCGAGSLPAACAAGGSLTATATTSGIS